MAPLELNGPDAAVPDPPPRRQTQRDTVEVAGFIERGRRAATSGAADEAIGWFERARIALAVNSPNADLADVLRWKGSVHADCGDTSEADRLYQESGVIAAAVGYVRGEAHALNCRGTIAQRRGELGVAEALYQHAAELAIEARDVRLASMVLRNMGIVASIRGHFDLAILRVRESYDRAREIDDDEGQCKALNNLATAYVESGRFAEAEPLFIRAMKLASRRGDRTVECGCRINLCEAMIGLGKLDEAEVECMAALGIAEWRGDRLRRAEGLKVLAVIAQHHGRDDEALSLIEEASELTAAGEDVILAGQLRRKKAEIFRARHQTADALRLFAEARDIYRQIGAAAQVATLDRIIASLRVPSADSDSASEIGKRL
jgi:tetratricopeptide (TPR) repeat protein